MADHIPDHPDRPGAFEHRVVSLRPGERRAFETADWTDALVLLACGDIELEGLGGHCERLASGAIFWLAGLPLRALLNAGAVPAVLVAVSRRKPASR